MIKVQIKIPSTAATDYNDKSAFETFTSLIDRMKSSGLKPTHFLGQVSPYLFLGGSTSDKNLFLWDSDGNIYHKSSYETYKNVTWACGEWKKSGKTLSMKERMTLPDTVPHPIRPECRIKSLKIYPGAEGMPKSIDELTKSMTAASIGFDNIEIANHIPNPENDVWDFPTTNPQALACFAGPRYSTFSLYVGSRCYYLPHEPIAFSHGKEGPALIFTSGFSDSVYLELTIKTNFRDTIRRPRRGRTLMSTVTSIGRKGEVLTEYSSHDIKLYPPLGCAFQDIPLVASILKKGVPDLEEVERIYPRVL